MGHQSALYTIVHTKLMQDALVLPTLPKIAIKIQETIEDPEVNLHKISHVISQDPALSLSILKVANSALLGRTVKATSLNQAVTRIGLTRIKSISTAMALSQIYISENEIVDMYFKKYWQKTVDVASVAIALMSFYLQKNKHSPLCLHTFTLAAMLHNIGVLPILTESERHAHVLENPTFIQEAIRKLSPAIGGDIMKVWGMPEEFTELVSHWSDLSILSQKLNYIDFIRAGAAYHHVFKNPQTCEVLMQSFIKKGMLPDQAFMRSHEFIEMKKNIKEMFSN